MRTLFLVPMLLLLTACSGGAGTRLSPATHDLSSPQPEANSAHAGILRQVEVQSPPWLDTTAMQYRLSYADRTRREAYAASRWAAPPARLLEQKLKQRLLGGLVPMQEQAGGCRLRVDLDEFVQDFVKPETSQVILEASATLLAPRADIFLARQHFRVVQPAGGDAPSGVVALAAAVRQFGDEIDGWLKQAGSETLKQCRLR